MRVFCKQPRMTALGNGPLGPTWTLQMPTREHPEPACRDVGVMELWWMWAYLDDDAREHFGRGIVVLR